MPGGGPGGLFWLGFRGLGERDPVWHPVMTSEAMAARGRTPRSRFYDGALYAALMDRLLSRLHGLVVDLVAPGSTVLDVGCGTGDVAIRLSPFVEAVVGVELSPAHVAYAQRRKQALDLQNVTFVLGDAAVALAREPPRRYDVALAVLVVHEIPAAASLPLLREAARLARRVVCVDFWSPMPMNRAGIRCRLLEAMAGREHFQAFRDYGVRGGLPGRAEAAGLHCRAVRRMDMGSMGIWELTEPGDSPRA